MLIRLVIAIAALGALCVGYGVVIERRWYRIVRRRLDILPTTGPEQLTVLHLSDLHFVDGERRKARFLASLPEADVTVVTGDFLAEPEAVETSVTAVRATRGRLASWFVLGSNDLYAPRPLNPLRYFIPHGSRRARLAQPGRWPELVELLEADGWHRLDNTRREIDLDGLPVELAGLHDAHIWRADLRVLPRREPERFGIAVMHSPNSAPEAAACGYELLIAGHTHGGQVRLPLVGALVTNCALPPRLVSGVIRIGGAVMSLSQGLGTSKYAPFRFWCRPEAVLLELRRAPQPPTARSNTRS